MIEKLEEILAALGNASAIFGLPVVQETVAKAHAILITIQDDTDALRAEVAALTARIEAILPTPAPITPALTNGEPG